MKSTGWDEIIEPEGIETFIATPRFEHIARAMLNHVCLRLHGDRSLLDEGLEVEVITACYTGDYPAIGVRFIKEPDDRDKLVKSIVDDIVRILNETSLLDWAVSLQSHN